MKQISPVHFVAALFQAIAPNAQRMRRHTERRGVLSVPMPLKFIASNCMVHNTEAQSKRCQCAGRNDSTDASFGASTAPSSAAVSGPSEANSADVQHVCAGLPRSEDDTHTASNLSSNDCASGGSALPSSALRYQAATCFNQDGLLAFAQERRGATEALHSSREPEIQREHTIEQMQDSDGYCRRPWMARLKQTGVCS